MALRLEAATISGIIEHLGGMPVAWMSWSEGLQIVLQLQAALKAGSSGFQLMKAGLCRQR